MDDITVSRKVYDDLIKGDKISIWGACSVATTLSSTNNRLSTFSIHKINGVS